MKKTTGQVDSKVRNGASRKQAGAKVSRTMLALEPRFMFDAAGVATAVDTASHALPDDAHRPDAPDDSVQSLVAALADQGPAAAQSANQERTEIVFIDTSVKDWAMLRDGVRDGVEVVLLDPMRDGLSQMEQALEGRSGIDAIHLLSHGSDGQLTLGNLPLNSGNVDEHADALGRIGAALSADGDLLIYGCDVGSSEGAAFISKLAEVTGADVAASDDPTGAAGFGGDWMLETTRGEVETGLAIVSEARQAYRGLLAAGTLTFNAATETNLGPVVTDELGVTDDIPGITYEIYAADSASPGSSNGQDLTYWDNLLGVEYAGVQSGIIGDDANGDAVLVVRSADGSQFDFRGLSVVNYLGVQSRVTIEGFRDGASTGSVTLDVDDSINYNSTYDISQLTRSVFQNVDAVRITNPDEVIDSDGVTSFGYMNYIALQNLVFGEPVVPNPVPAVDANGAAGGTTNTTTFTENGAAVRIVTSDASLTDDDNITGMTFTLGATPDGTNEIITYNAALNGGASLASLGLSGSYDSATRTYTISGSAAAPFYQGAMRAMVYSNASDGPNTTARTITISATDAEGGVGQTTTTVNVVAVNDPPTATNMTQSRSATEGGGAVTLNDIVVTDADTGDTITATLTLSDPAAGSLSTGTFGSATSTWNAGTGVWTVTGSVADVNAALAAVALTPSANNNQNFTITTRIRDAADTGPADGTISISVTPVNDAPTATNLTQGRSATEGGGAVTLNDIVVTDVDTGDTITATLTLSDPDAGSLSTGTFGSATSTWNAGTGVWTVSGSVADVNAALAAVALIPSANNDQNFTITTRIRDAADTGPADGTISITVTPVNDAPTATNLTQSLSATEGGGAVALNDIVVSDVDTGDTITATLTLSNSAAGSLSVGTFGSATSTWNAGTGVWTVSGSVADVNAALAAVALIPSANNDQNFTITTRIRDASGTGPADGTISFTVTPVNDAPTITAPGSISVTEDVASALTGISFADVDAGANAVTVTLSVPSGALAATSGSGVTVGGTSSALTLTGTIADINAFIAASNVVFTAASNATASVTLTVEIDDGGNSGSGGAQQDQTTVSLDVTAVNDAPQISAPGSIALTVNEAEALAGISFADVDAGASNVTVTLSVPSGTLSASSGGGVTVGGTSSALTLTGTIANLNAFIAGSNVTYTTALDATVSVTLTILIDDNGNTGSGGAQQESTTLTLSPSARPVITIGGSASYAEDGPATVVAPGLTITDSDSSTLAGAVVTLTDFVSGDELSFIDQNGIVGSYNSATGVLTLTGVATQAQYQAALRSITYVSTHDNPATGAGNADRVIEFRVSDGDLQSEAGTSQTLTVTNTNDAPMLDASASPALNGLIEDAAPPVNGSTAGSTLVSALTGGISDVDTGALQGIAIVGASERGLLWYSTDGGLTWTVAPALSDSSSLLLASDARIYFQPAADVSGVIEDAITFRAWDRTTGANGGTANTSAQGGATAFSTEIDSASITIAPVNDAPAIGSAPTLSGLEDSVVTIDTASLNFADVDSGDSLQSITVTGLPGNGTLFVDANDNGVLDGGEAIVAGQMITAGDIDAGRFKFVAAPNASGAGYASFQYTVSDGIASSTPATAVIDILPVNDAPTATNLTQTVTYVEDAASVALGGIVVADVDTDDTITATLTLSNVAAGSLSTGTFGAATSSYDANTGVWTVAGSVADVNAALAAVAFTPAANWDRNITVTTRIRDSAGTGPADGSIALNVTAANDAPVAAGTIAAIEGTIDRSLHVVLPAGLFSDVDRGDELTLSVANLPAGLTFDAATGTISGTPTGEQGEHVAQLIATDRAGATATIAFSVRIAAPELSPPQPQPPQPQPQPQAPPPWVNMESGPAIVATPSSGPRTSSPGTAPVVMTLPDATPRISFSAPQPFAPVAMASQSRFGVDMPPLSESAPAAPSSGSSGSLAFLAWSASSRQGASSIVLQTDPPDVAVERDVSAAGSTMIALPPRTFAAEGASQITIEASLADGRPLPSWVRFDPREGSFTLNPPEGFEGSLDVRVTAQTEQGQSATAEFKIVVSSKGDENAARGGETARSKPSLSEQLRAAGEDGLLAEAAEFLERLADSAAA